jgi:hypothetical protein
MGLEGGLRLLFAFDAITKHSQFLSGKKQEFKSASCSKTAFWVNYPVVRLEVLIVQSFPRIKLCKDFVNFRNSTDELARSAGTIVGRFAAEKPC